jgi:hypothetical protein
MGCGHIWGGIKSKASLKTRENPDESGDIRLELEFGGESQ